MNNDDYSDLLRSILTRAVGVNYYNDDWTSITLPTPVVSNRSQHNIPLPTHTEEATMQLSNKTPLNKSPNKLKITVKRKRIPLRKLIHDKPLNEAIEALKSIRTMDGFGELEFLHKHTLTLKYSDVETLELVAQREETDKEYSDRQHALAKQREEQEARKRAKAIKDKQLAEAREQARKDNAMSQIKTMLDANKLTEAELIEFLSSYGLK